jgi:AcrR family transcriptional regulator
MDTRDRIIESACEVFAEKGYQSATISEICERGKANIASVNYYFGSKEELYDEVLRRALEIVEQKHPLHGNLAEGASPADRLQAFISALLLRTLVDGPGGWFQRLVTHERTSATSHVVHKFRAMLRRNRDLLEEIVSELIGRPLPDDVAHRYSHFIISICVAYGFNQYSRERFMEEAGGTPEVIARLTADATRFIMGGIAAVGGGVATGEPENDITPPETKG